MQISNDSSPNSIYSFMTKSLLLLLSFLYLHGTVKAQSWNPTSGSFNGSGEFMAVESSDPWVGPQLSATNGGELRFLGDVEHNGGTGVLSSSQVIVGGAFNHTNSFQSFSVRDSDGMGNFSSLTITDVANSNVSSRNFDVQSSTLNLNSVTAAGNALVRDVATLDILGDFDVGGSTTIVAGSDVNVGGAFNHTNSFQSFSVRDSDGMGNFSSLTITDVANSNVSSRNFDVQSSTLNLNSVTAAGNALVRDVATLDILGDFDVGGSTTIVAGSDVNVGGAFNHTNSFQSFSVRDSDGMGNFSSLTIADIANSIVSSRNFDVQSSELSLNSVAVAGDALIRDSATLNVLQDFDASGAVSIPAGSWVFVGGDFTKINENRSFSVSGSDFFGVRSMFEVEGTTIVVASSFTLDGPSFFSGMVATATDAIVFDAATISPRAGEIGQIDFDTTGIATENHALEIRSRALYEWEFNELGSDEISVNGDLQLSDFWELEISAIADAVIPVSASDEFTLFTYSGDLNASVDAQGLLTRLTIDSSKLPEAYDASSVAVFDDGAGRVFLTGLSSGSALLGDVNRDGVVDFLDISAFIAVLSVANFQEEADLDQNGMVNFLDISVFIQVLSAQ